MRSISFAIPVCNERREVERLLSQINIVRRDIDEVLILFDADNGADEVYQFITSLDDVKVIEAPLDNDFAKFKNNFNKYATKDVIIQLDADEEIGHDFIRGLEQVYLDNDAFDTCDVILVSRVNTVIRLEKDDIYEWGWRLTKPDAQHDTRYYDISSWNKSAQDVVRASGYMGLDGRYLLPYVNFPDLQFRIYKNNGKIKWTGKVHEKLTGYRTYALFSHDFRFCILHEKTIERQRKQNNFYSNI